MLTPGKKGELGRLKGLMSRRPSRGAMDRRDGARACCPTGIGAAVGIVISDNPSRRSWL